MSVFRIHKSSNYTIMSNYHLRDQTLKISTIGVLSIMLSLPENWDYTEKGLAAITSAGRDAIRSALQDLEEHGYLYRERTRYPNGKYKDMEYNIYECPQNNPHYAQNHDGDTPAQPLSDYPTLAEPMLDNPTQNKKEKNNKESNNKRYINPSSTQKHEPAHVRELIQAKVNYTKLPLNEIDKAIADYCINLMTETICFGHGKYVIGNSKIPIEQLRSVLAEYRPEYFVNACKQMQKAFAEKQIKNPKSYALSILYNAALTALPYTLQQLNTNTHNQSLRSFSFSFERDDNDFAMIEDKLVNR